jgi:hypothetical protein
MPAGDDLLRRAAEANAASFATIAAASADGRSLTEPGGAPVYARLGYRDLHWVQMWRRPADG